MSPRSLSRLFRVVLALALFSPWHGEAQTAVTRLPADKAVGVNPDAHLVLTFSAPPTLGKSGQVRIYEAVGHRLVDTLDLSIPAGPDPSRRVAATSQGVPLDPSIPIPVVLPNLKILV